MRNETLWFASLCAQAGVLDQKNAAQIAFAVPPDADPNTFAQQILDRRLTADIPLLTRLLEEARTHAAAGLVAPPLHTLGKPVVKTAAPFAPKPTVLPIAPPAAAPAPAAAVPPPVPVAVPATPVPVPATPPPPAPAATAKPKIDFASVQNLSADEAKTFMLGLLAHAQQMGASDLHLSAGAPPFVRNLRALAPLNDTPLSAADSHKLNTCLLSPDEAATFERTHDHDYALAMSGGRRIRINLMVHKDGVKGTYRVVPENVRTPAELGFKNTAVIERLLSYHNGLILVTGPVGSGKTTTLNSLIDQLNRTRDDHIITIEDPIEYLHQSQGCIVTQRQAGQHTDSFAAALKGALREDPDVIVIGELRDLETIELAISASETGHLVIGTMHTSDATSTLNRILDVFPPGQQSQIRAMVSQSLRGILCQRLLPSTNGSVALACEILINNTAVGAMVRDGKTQGITNALDTGRRLGMISMDNAILELWQEKKISDDVAAANILNRNIRRAIPGAV